MTSLLSGIRAWAPAQLLVFNAAAVSAALLFAWQRHSLRRALDELTLPSPIVDPDVLGSMVERQSGADSIQQLVDLQGQSFVDAINQSWRLQASISQREYMIIAVVVIALAVDWIWAGRKNTARTIDAPLG